MLSRFLLSLLLLGAAAPAAQAKQCGEASFYGTASDGYPWQTMANGRPMNPAAMTAAHPSLPFGTKLLVTNRDNGRHVVLTIADRGPFHGGRILDMSAGSFSRIAKQSQGTARVCIARL